MSDFIRSIRDFTADIFGFGTPSRKQNGSITIKESEFSGNAQYFIRKSLRGGCQVIVRDESGSVMMVLGKRGYALFPHEHEEEGLEDGIDLSADMEDPRLYDSWLR